MNFGPWGEATRMDHGGDNQSQNLGGNGGNGNSHPEVPESGNFTHQVEHSGVVCDSCDTPIFGFRYKCMQCPDFDLCSTCERRGLHAGHIMMRIAFPEQAAEAIRRFLSPPGSPCRPPHTPRFGLFPPGHSRHSFHGPHGRGGKGHKRHGKDRSPDTSDDETGAGAAAPNPDTPACPYNMSKKELKRLAKCMKKASFHGRKSAEAYAQHAAASVNAAGQALPDYTAVISQIQEYLNYFGIPIDVVTLYDQYGNSTSVGSQTGGTANAAQATGGTTGTQAPEQATTGTNIPIRVEGSQASNVSPVRDAGAGIANQLQGLHIQNSNNVQPDIGLSAFGSLSRMENVSIPLENYQNTTVVSASGDAEGDADWTMLEADRVADSTVPNVTSTESVASAPPLIDISSGPPSVVSPLNSMGADTNGNGVRQVSFSTENSSEPVPPAPATKPQPQIAPGAPQLYPQLPAQLQQVMNGVSKTLGTALQNIPIAVRGPAPNLSPQQTNGTAQPQSLPALDPRMTMTLNQLLSMGFSNHDGWLARLVVSKNGDLDSVLNALFPAEQN